MDKLKRPYAGRIRSERARLGLSQSQLALAGAVSKTTQVAYESGAPVPDLEYVDGLESLGIDKVFICWGIREAEFVAQRFDWELHRDITVAIFELATERNFQVPPAKLADLIHLLYDDFVINRSIEPAKLERALRLVAA